MLARRFFLILSIALGSFFAAPAQEPVKPPVSPRIITATRQVAIFTNLETQLLLAVQSKDQAALAKLISDDCLIEMPDADPLTGEDWIASVMAKDYSLKSFTLRQMSVADQGDSAVVKFDRIQQSSSKGVSNGGEFFVVDLWKKEGDAWKLSNRYVAKVSTVPWMPKGDVRPTGKK